MTRLSNIPKTEFYPGMTRHHLGGDRYLQVFSAGPEADEAIKRHLARK